MAATTTTRRGSAWRTPAVLVAMSVMPAIGGAVRLGQLAGGAEITPENARFFAMPIPIVLHVLAALPFAILGAFQFVPKLRRGAPSWHKIAGRALAPLGMVVALTGLWMTLLYPWAEGDGLIVYLSRLIFGTAMAAAIVIGMDAIRRRDFAAHGDWMLRAYAIGMGAATQVITHIPIFVLIGKPAGWPRALAMASAWVINVLVAEWIIRRRGRVERAPRVARALAPAR